MDNFDVNDTILYPITYSDLVLMAQNINPNFGRTLREELRNLLREKTREALELFDEHEQEIYAEAFEDESEEENSLGAEKTEALAWDIYKLLRKHKIWMDTRIYFNGKCLSTSNRGADNKWEFRYNGDPFILEDIQPQDYFDYAGSILSMSFEGPFYEAMNYSGGSVIDEFNELLKRYGVYYELGNTWNLTLAEI